MASKNTLSISMKAQSQTRLLLALWDLGGAEQEVKKGEVTKRIVVKGKKVADYQSIIAELEEKGAIIISKKGYSLVSPHGLEILSENLKNPESRFEGTIVGSWVANALLKWIGESQNSVVVAPVSSNGNSNGNGKKTEIKSYNEFKKITLDVYEQLNRDYNFDNLVPIYRIHRFRFG
jgi:hypothetical protein